jgi:hypothetical protein
MVLINGEKVISTWLRLQTVFTGSGYQGMKAKGS